MTDADWRRFASVGGLDQFIKYGGAINMASKYDDPDYQLTLGEKDARKYAEELIETEYSVKEAMETTISEYKIEGLSNEFYAWLELQLENKYGREE